MLKNSQDSYGLIARILHWVTALAVLGLFGLGWWMVDLTYYSEWYKTAPDIHRSIGLILAMLIIFRIIWRSVNPTPQTLSTHKHWEVKSAHAMHLVLYVLLFAMFITGYLISTAKGQPIEVFNWFSVPAIVTGDDLGISNLEDRMGEIHEILAYTLIGLAVIHALAALKHHIIDKDETLKRMLGKR